MSVLIILEHAETLVALNGRPFSLVCPSNNSSSAKITWLQTRNKTTSQLQVVNTSLSDGRISISGDGRILNFTSVNLYDDEYYSCGTLDSQEASFALIESFYLFVEGEQN